MGKTEREELLAAIGIAPVLQQNIIQTCLCDRCVGIQRHRHGLHILCSTVKTVK